MSMLITFSQRHCTPVYHRGAQTTVRWCFVGSGNSLVLQSRKSFKLIFMLMCFFKCTGLELMAATGAGSSNCFNAERDLILKWLTFWDEISPQQKIHSSFLYIQGDFLNCPPPRIQLRNEKTSQPELLFHEILYLGEPLVDSLAFFILILNKGGPVKKITLYIQNLSFKIWTKIQLQNLE